MGILCLPRHPGGSAGAPRLRQFCLHSSRLFIRSLDARTVWPSINETVSFSNTCHRWKFVPLSGNHHNAAPRRHETRRGAWISWYIDNRLGQDHRGIDGRIRCMRGFKSHDAADRLCREHSKLRNLLRSRRRRNKIVSASLRRARPALRSISCRMRNWPAH